MKGKAHWRRVSTSGSGLPAQLGWLLVILGALFIAADLRLQIRLAVFGETTVGVVEASPPARRRVVSVRFQLPSGETQLLHTGANLRMQYPLGQKLDVVYLPGNPALAEIANIPQLWFPLLLQLLLGGICLAGGIAILRGARRRVGSSIASPKSRLAKPGSR